MTEELRAVVHGLVQGVWFRQFTVTEATGLGLVGWVRNCEGGRSVELVARGERSALESLVALVRTGPSDARVDSVDVEWRAAGSEAIVGFGARE